MSIFESTVLGLIQGLTEFLPISSSAHLVLAPYFFNWQDPGLAFDVALHMGTLAALLLAFRKDWIEIARQIFDFLKKPATERPSSDTPSVLKIIVGCIPAGVVGLFLEKYAEETFRSPLLIAITLSIFGTLLWYFDSKGKKEKSLDLVSYKHALFIGCAQAIAIIPGVSRSGVTITAALLLGFTRAASMRFSFLLSAPIIAAAGLLKTKHIISFIQEAPSNAVLVFVGFLASLVSGLLAILILNYLVKSRSFISFVYYRYVLTLIIIAVIVFR